MSLIWRAITLIGFFAAIFTVAIGIVRSQVKPVGVSVDVERICVAESCKDLSKAEYRALKDNYKLKLKNKQEFTLIEYQELVAIIDKEAKKNPIILKDHKGELTVDMILNALK